MEIHPYSLGPQGLLFLVPGAIKVSFLSVLYAAPTAVHSVTWATLEPEPREKKRESPPDSQAVGAPSLSSLARKIGFLSVFSLLLPAVQSPTEVTLRSKPGDKRIK